MRIISNIENSTVVANAFIQDYLPSMNGDCVRVYLYGLRNFNLEEFAGNLGLSHEDVMACFTHLTDLGLVQIAGDTVTYLPIKTGVKRYRKGHWDDFNQKIQGILTGRMITPTEFNEYYYLIESMDVSPDALLIVAKHCAEVKGPKVGYKYIVTVAKNLTYDGARSVGAVKKELAEQNAKIERQKEIGSKEKKRVVNTKSFKTKESSRPFDNPDDIIL